MEIKDMEGYFFSLKSSILKKIKKIALKKLELECMINFFFNEKRN